MTDANVVELKKDETEKKDPTPEELAQQEAMQRQQEFLQAFGAASFKQPRGLMMALMDACGMVINSWTNKEKNGMKIGQIHSDAATIHKLIECVKYLNEVVNPPQRMPGMGPGMMPGMMGPGQIGQGFGPSRPAQPPTNTKP